MSPPRTWTVAEARAALPRVRELLLVLQRAANLATKVRSNGHAALHSSNPDLTNPDLANPDAGNPESEPGSVEEAVGESKDIGVPGAGVGAGGAEVGGASGASASGALGTGGGIQPILDGLEELGIVLRDPARGVIDFPAVHLGRQVHLCWQLGEDDIGWWHLPDEGFAGRHPLPLPESW